MISDAVGGMAFITDSAPGAEALIILDLATGKAVRRLDGAVQVRSTSDITPIVGSQPLLDWSGQGAPRPFAVGLNGLELSADGETLYFNSFTGRHLYAISTVALCDPAISNEELARRIKLVGSIGVAGHLSIDSDGPSMSWTWNRTPSFGARPMDGWRLSSPIPASCGLTPWRSGRTNISM